MDLPFDDHRVQDRPAVLHDDVALDAEGTGLHVDHDLHGMGRIRVRAVLGIERVTYFEARLMPVGRSQPSHAARASSATGTEMVGDPTTETTPSWSSRSSVATSSRWAATWSGFAPARCPHRSPHRRRALSSATRWSPPMMESTMCRRPRRGRSSAARRGDRRSPEPRWFPGPAREARHRCGASRCRPVPS